jgi:hypothetical protein
MLMEDLESTSSNVYNAYFVDLFVRASNAWVLCLGQRHLYLFRHLYLTTHQN